MRVLLDACVDPRVVELFRDHDVKTAFEMGWHLLKDHVLVAAIQGRFDVFVTIDRGFEHEHNLANLRFGIVIVHVPINRVEHYRRLQFELIGAVERVPPGHVEHVRSPETAGAF